MTTERRPPGLDLDGFEWKLVLSSLLAGTYSLAWLGLDAPAKALPTAPALVATIPLSPAEPVVASSRIASSAQATTLEQAAARPALEAPSISAGPPVADARSSRKTPARTTRRVRTRSS